MADKKKNKVKLLLDFSFDDTDLSNEEVRNILTEYGYDPDDLIERGNKFVRELYRKQKKNKVSYIREKIEQAIQSVSDVKEEYTSKKELLDAFKKRISARGEESKPVQAFFHKLESKLETLSENELKDMLDEANISKLIDDELRKMKEEEENDHE